MLHAILMCLHSAMVDVQRRSNSMSNSDLQLLRWHLVQANLNHHIVKGMSPAMSQAASFSRGSRALGNYSRSGLAPMDTRVPSMSQRLSASRLQSIHVSSQDSTVASAPHTQPGFSQQHQRDGRCPTQVQPRPVEP